MTDYHRRGRSPSPHRHQRFRNARSTRWDDGTTKTFVPGVPSYIPSSLSRQEVDALLLRIRIEEIGWKVQNNQFDLQYFRKRSPSPAPSYDAQGKRTNTRDQRAKQRLVNERHYLIEKACKVNPHFKPPADYRSMSTKRTKKIYIPINKYPEYNFIGLIIGPRGLTQKQMEKESGAKIAIRGKGSVKDGKGKNQGGDEDALHVLITADTKKQINMMVKKLLVPIEEGKNEHKRAQLRKLAEINGTLRDNVWQPSGRTWTSADVYCKHCGEISHPSSDCPLKGKRVAEEVINSEYDNFLSEIGFDPNELASAEKQARTDAEKSYEQFMSSLKDTAPAQQQANPWEQAAGGQGYSAPAYGQGYPQANQYGGWGQYPAGQGQYNQGGQQYPAAGQGQQYPPYNAQGQYPPAGAPGQYPPAQGQQQQTAAGNYNDYNRPQYPSWT